MTEKYPEPKTPEEAQAFITQYGTLAAWERSLSQTGKYFRKLQVSRIGPGPDFREFSMTQWVEDGNEEKKKQFFVEAAAALYRALSDGMFD